MILRNFKQNIYNYRTIKPVNFDYSALQYLLSIIIFTRKILESINYNYFKPFSFVPFIINMKIQSSLNIIILLITFKLSWWKRLNYGPNK